MKYKPYLKQFNLEAFFCVFICSLKSPLSGLEMMFKIMPGSVGLNVKLIMLKVVDCSTT